MSPSVLSERAGFKWWPECAHKQERPCGPMNPSHYRLKADTERAPGPPGGYRVAYVGCTVAQRELEGVRGLNSEFPNACIPSKPDSAV